MASVGCSKGQTALVLTCLQIAQAALSASSAEVSAVTSALSQAEQLQQRTGINVPGAAITRVYEDLAVQMSPTANFMKFAAANCALGH